MSVIRFPSLLTCISFKVLPVLVLNPFFKERI